MKTMNYYDAQKAINNATSNYTDNELDAMRKIYESRTKRSTNYRILGMNNGFYTFSIFGKKQRMCYTETKYTFYPNGICKRNKTGEGVEYYKYV